MSASAAVNTLQALVLKADSRLETLCRDLENKSTSTVTVCEVGRRLARTRATCDQVTQQLQELVARREATRQQLAEELQLLGKLSDQLTAYQLPAARNVSGAGGDSAGAV